ncbi:hypothetical protein WN48_01548 [Eufriesea mexicana]|nr:hypothetical protein WN48_01548 [Eufriesea mexicana]
MTPQRSGFWAFSIVTICCLGPAVDSFFGDDCELGRGFKEKFTKFTLQALLLDSGGLFLLVVLDYDLSKYKNVTRWFAKMKSEAPKYEEYNNAGVKAFKAMVDSMTKQ